MSTDSSSETESFDRAADPAVTLNLKGGAAATHLQPQHKVAADDGSSSPSGERFKTLRMHAQGGLGQVFVALDKELNMADLEPKKPAKP